MPPAPVCPPGAAVRPPRTRLPWLGLVVLVAWGQACRKNQDQGMVTQAVRRGDLRDVVAATGQVSARNKVNVGSQVSGRVARVLVDYNARVARDQLLAELDPRLLRAQLASEQATQAVAAAEVDKAQVTVADSERTLARQRELGAQRMVAQADIDQAQMQRDAAAAALQGARARLAQARAVREQAAANLSFTRILSPIDGIVIDRPVEPGQTVAAQMQVTTLFVVADDMRQIRVLADVDESDVGKIAPAMSVVFSVDAFTGVRFPGHIRDVRQVPSAAAGAAATVVTYAADILADNPDGRLRHGMTAHVDVVVGERRGVLTIPNRALRFVPSQDDEPATSRAPAAAAGQGDDGGDPPGQAAEGRPGRAFVLVAGRPEAVNLRLGMSDGMATEVLAGLEEGASVITGQRLGSRRRRGWF